MVSIIQAVILSFVEGITEWFPVSSKGHLYIMQSFFGFQSLSFDVFLHFAAVLAVIVMFWREIIAILNLKKRENWNYIFYIIIATVPVGIFGLLFKKEIESFFYQNSNPIYVGVFFIISGILIYSTKFFKAKKDNLNWFDSLFIGVFQAIALFPGVSRSGATISSGIFRGLKKEKVVKFSFLLAIPAILGAGVLEAKDIVGSQISYGILILSFIITFLVSLVTIKLLLRIIKSDRFYLFGVYNFVLGLLVLIWSFVI
jgi:undecaprenyl-diphosphatase